MKKRVLVDLRIECDPPRFVYQFYRSMEQRANALEDWVKDFHEFIRDHRSQDPVTLNVERVYEERCGYCGNTWEEDADGPVCCNAAVDDWRAAQALTESTEAK